MLKRSLVGLTLLAGAAVPSVSNAATVTIEMHNNFFQPTAIVAQSGDTVVIRNLGGRKVVQSYSDSQLAPTTLDSNQSVSFVFNGTPVGLRADDVDPQTPALSSVDGSGNCTGMCARVTPTGPQFPPQTPVINSPANGAQVGNTVTFSGTASAASKVRIKIGSLVRTTNVDGTGSWVLSQALANGAYTATATSIHPEGFESSPSSVSFTVAGSDTVPPTLLAGTPAFISGSPTPVKVGTLFVGHGAIRANGVVVDDVTAKKVTATIRDALVPDTEVAIVLTCSVPDGQTVPCDAATNPPRIQYRGQYLPARPGHFILTTTATDAAGATTTVVQDILVLSPL